MALTRRDPYGGDFAVELDDVARAGFEGCTGLDSTVTATKHREGNDPTLASGEISGHFNCWPTRWTGAAYASAADALGIETQKLAHAGLGVPQWG